MAKCIIGGMDVHERNIKVMWAAQNGKPVVRDFANSCDGRWDLITRLRTQARQNGCQQIVLCYEASCLGFGLYDELTDAGITCHVLAPSLIRKSRKDVKRKTDLADAKMLFETLRGHVLAGNDLPTVWIPPKELRADRELVRMRLTVANKVTEIKSQIGMLLKKNELRRPKDAGKGWTADYRKWLQGLTSQPDLLAPMIQLVLGSLLRQLASMETEEEGLDKAILELAETPRYQAQCRAISGAIKGVGILTAMVFLTELGDLSRFRNRRQLASFLGLTPSSDESGEVTNRKGHICRCGPSRVRWMLCQASWSHIAHTPAAREAYDRIRKNSDKLKKVGLVATMRRLAIIMWHKGMEATTGITALTAA
jgi:transposase